MLGLWSAEGRFSKQQLLFAKNVISELAEGNVVSTADDVSEHDKLCRSCVRYTQSGALLEEPAADVRVCNKLV